MHGCTQKNGLKVNVAMTKAASFRARNKPVDITKDIYYNSDRPEIVRV